MGQINTIVYQEDWATKLQERLDYTTLWKEICRVDYTNSKVLHNPYLTDPTVQTGYRGTAYDMQEVVQTDESVDITNYKVLAQFIDRADLAQSTYTNQMELADAQGQLLNEAIETAMFIAGAGATNFGTENLAGTTSGGSSAITVSNTNIDDIIRSVKSALMAYNGMSLMNRNGVFIVWRVADYELLEAYVQANGFVVSDNALKNGLPQGFQYMGVSHYCSNNVYASHVFAGVKKILHLGILRATYGQVMVNEKDPGNTSGISIVSRVDYAFKIWTKTARMLLDINVA